MKIKIGFSLSAIMLITSCVAGLKRTDIFDFKTYEFPDFGIKFEIPQKVDRLRFATSSEYQREWECKILTFSLHPVYPETLAEPIYLINFRIVMLEKSAYDLYLKIDHVENADRRFKDTNFHEEVTEFDSSRPYDMAGSITLRRDFKNPKTGDVVLAAATYIPDPQHRDKDIDAIKRILNSIEFLDGVRR